MPKNPKNPKNNAEKSARNEKEIRSRRRVQEALLTLQKQIPFLDSRPSKIQTIRLAIEYINHLRTMLENEKGPIENFEYTVLREMTIKNSYTERAMLEENQ